jgi:quercetin dioxygenase-like cupin family protein
MASHQHDPPRHSSDAQQPEPTVTRLSSKELTAGQTFYEGPEDIHVVGRNASATKPAKVLAILVKNKGAPPLVPVK